LQRLRVMLIDASFNPVTKEILAAAIEVHRTLGPGLLESTYSQCLQIELTSRRLQYVTQQTIPITYKGITLETGYRIDLIVEERVVVEVKSVAGILPVHKAQVLTYLALTGCPVGLLINFNAPTLMEGVKRLVNKRVPLS
jgi:GxxExxY protein